MQKITIKNFRQIPDAEIEIKKLLLLVGEQASGKSTLAKLIYFFKSLKEDYFNLVYENANKSVSNLEREFIGIIEDKFKVYFGYTSELADNFEITFYYNFVSESSTENRYLKLSKQNRALNVQFERRYFRYIVDKTNSIVQEIVNFTQNQIGANETNYLIIERAKVRFINDLTYRVNELFYDHYSPQFFPAGRNITVSFPEQFQASFLSALPSNHLTPNSVDLVLMKSFILHSKFLYDYFRGNAFSSEIRSSNQSKVSQNILTFFIQHAEYILQGKYSNAEGNEKIVYGTQNSEVPLNVASSGQQESIRIIQDLLYLLLENQKSFRIMEEPEAHLYPKAQKNLVELMALIINKTQSQIIITTHSPYVLSILNNLLMYSVVTENNPNAHPSIKAHFGTVNLNDTEFEKINLTQNQVQAYSLSINRENYCTSIIDEDTGLIGENFLDTVTEELNNDFNTLYNLNFQIH